MDLLFSYSWREANVGALLAALAAPADCLEILRQVKPRLPHGTKVVALALASCGDTLPEELTEHFQLLQEIRAMLAEIPHEPLPLRRNYSVEQEREFNRIGPTLRQRHPKISESELPQVIQEIGYGEFMLSHKEWLMQTHPGNMYCRLTRHLQWQGFLVRHAARQRLRQPMPMSIKKT
ncbi:MAG: hypothetical protein HYZ45_02615 [Burkholderiales bacterium]|nr:hypothetical protein [Burkholderiales bacterium]